MKIFISWSGERSKSVASALRSWLPLVLHYAEPWMSEIDIQSGTRGMSKVAEELEGRNYGIICITAENLRAPWVNFEAGALSKSVAGGMVVPLLLGLDAKDVPPPIGQFQAKKIDREGIRILVSDINKSASAPIQEGRLEDLFSLAWSKLEEDISRIPTQSKPVQPIRRSEDIMEELVTGVRGLESHFQRLVNDDDSRNVSSPRRLRKFSPKAFAEVTKHLSSGPDQHIGLLMIAGLFREEMPWVSEVFVNFYREFASSNSLQRNELILQLRSFVARLEMGNPYLREFYGESREMQYILADLTTIVKAVLPQFD